MSRARKCKHLASARLGGLMTVTTATSAWSKKPRLEVAPYQSVESAEGGDCSVKNKKSPAHTCSICGKVVPSQDAIPAGVVRESIRNIIRQDHPEWSPDGYICREDLSRFRSRYVEELLQSERRELTALEQDVIESLREHELISENVDGQFERAWSLGEKLADRLADAGGSWSFLMGFGVLLGLWILLNAFVLIRRPFDPYPFILLNLVLSCIAAIQAPVIMMSQKRQEAKDRLRSQHDYKINLKAELEIRQLHEKLDHLLSHQWERLLEVQEVQLELLEEIGGRRGR
jgi:uncharacterized membrane protein